MCLVCPTNDRVEQAPLELQVAPLFRVCVRARESAAQFSLYQIARRLQRRISVFIVRRQIRRWRRRLWLWLGRGRL